MSREEAFQELSGALRGLREALGDLRTTLLEDRPLKDDVALADALADSAEDVAGWLEEAAGELERGMDPSGGMESARRAFESSQPPYRRFVERLLCDLISYERLSELLSLGRERGGEWLAWARSVKEALDRCLSLFIPANASLFSASLEWAGGSGTTSVSLTATQVLPLSRSTARKRSVARS